MQSGGAIMNQIKIGQFIAKCRKEKQMTQMELADRLGITDRAISKWERGKGMPDTSIMLDLCNQLDISVNELLSGEKIEMKDYNKIAEQNLLELQQQNEAQTKQLLKYECFIGAFASVIYIGSIFLASYIEMPIAVKVLLIVFGIIIFLCGVFTALRIEQTAGYYQCKECGHKYVPTYKAVFFAPHMGRTRKLTCPQCGKRSWSKKVIK